MKKKEKTAKPVVLPGIKKLPQPITEEVEAVESKKNTTEAEEEDEEEINIIFDDEGNEIETSETPSASQPSSTTATASPTKPQAKGKKELSPEVKAKKQESINALREKLASKIQLLKEKRKAPGTKTGGAPVSREAILEERKRKAELKAAAKAERKRKASEMEQEDDDDEDNSDSSDDEEEEEEEELSAKNVLFQNIVFDDNTKATSDLQNIRTNHLKKKGPAKKDLTGHLKRIEQKKEKLETMDETKRKTIEEREKWARTLAAAEGTKLRDDEKLLKKALKRKEAKKLKSEIEWRDRKDHVETLKNAKVKRREENLAIRKENKGLKRKQQTKQLRKFKIGKSGKAKRAGFEGRLKSGKK